MQSTFHLRPAAFLAGGYHRPITNRLEATGDPELPWGVDELIDCRFATGLRGQSPVVHFGHGRSMVRITPLNANKVNGQLLENGVLYPEAWAGADLKLLVGGHFLRKEIGPFRPGYQWRFAFRADAGLFDSPEYKLQPPYLYKDADVVPLEWRHSLQRGKRVLTVDLPLVGNWEGWTLDPTFTSTQTSADADTMLSSVYTTRNYGIATTVGSGNPGGERRRGLLQIDCIGADKVPAGSTIVSATVTLRCLSESAATDYNIGLHRGLSQWFEGLQNGATPGAGEDGSTWGNRNYNGAVVWLGGAGGGSGSDYAASATATVVITAPNTNFAFDVTADVAAWASGTPNYGHWILNVNEGTNNSYKAFGSSDNATASNRPKLVVVYTLPSQGFTRTPFWGRYY